MFKQLYNHARLVFTIKPVTPLLIKTGRDTFDPTRPNLEFVRTRTKYGEVPYLPGSSLKGAMRSHAERILRTLSLRCCDITESDNCGRDNQSVLPAERYRRNCYCCRTFGSASLAGRLSLADAYPWPVGAPDEEVSQVCNEITKHIPMGNRTSVAIHRRKGTTAGEALFEAEVVSGGQFHGEITLVNYQLWQLALLALVVRDINHGMQRLGAAKSRGLGRVKFSAFQFEFRQYGPLASNEKIMRGLGSLGKELVEKYDLVVGADSLKLQDNHWKQSDQSFKWVIDHFLALGDISEAWLQLSRELVDGENWQALLAMR